MALSTGADSPNTITHAFVLSGAHLVWSVLEGEKVFPANDPSEKPTSMNSKHIENRQTRLSPGWYAVILAKGNKGDTEERRTQCHERLPCMELPPIGHEEIRRQQGCVVGIVKISHSLPYEFCKDSPWAVQEYKVCNIISHAGWIDEPIACKGNLGACPIEDEVVRDRVRAFADFAYKDGSILPTGGDLKYPYRGPAVWDKGRKRKPSVGCIDLKDKDEVGRLRAFLLECCEKDLSKRTKEDQSVSQ